MVLTLVQHRQIEAAAMAGAIAMDNRDLRRQLADAICDRNAADAAARVAKDVADKAGRARQEAADAVSRLKAVKDAFRLRSIEHASRSFAE